MQQYVCSFLFAPDRARVLLIRKRRPAWQAGKLNGIGGKVEPGEPLAEAAAREFREETGLDLAPSAFRHGITLTGTDDGGSGRDWQGHFFRAFGPIDEARSITDEQVEVHPVTPLPPDTIPNLRWMIPLLLDDEPLAAQYQVSIVTGP